MVPAEKELMQAQGQQAIRILFRADGDDRIGSGHLRRCISLATRLREWGADCRFACRQAEKSFNVLVSDAGFPLVELPATARVKQAVDAEQTIAATSSLGAFDAVVVDHYELGQSWERALRSIAARMVAIDDLADRLHDCDLLIDPAPGDSHRYVSLVPTHCTTLLGPDYAMLRQEFRLGRQRRSDRFDEIKRVLVSFGGVDPDNLTGSAVAAARRALPHAQLDVVATHLFCHLPVLSSIVQQYARVKLHVDAGNMAELMQVADIAIGAGGTTSWERACLGLPSLVVVAAANQQATADALTRLGCALPVPAGPRLENELATALQALSSSSALLRLMSVAAQQAVDGRGIDRVARAIMPTAVEMRPARDSDARLVWQWRNSPEIRATSADSSEILWDDHRAWFARKLDDPQTLMLLAEHAGEAVGFVRFDLVQDRAMVSIFLAPGFAGRGFGLAALQGGESWLRAHNPEIRAFYADVRPENHASIALFESAGYGRRLLHFERIEHD